MLDQVRRNVEEATCLHEVVIVMNTVLFVINYHDWHDPEYSFLINSVRL